MTVDARPAAGQLDQPRGAVRTPATALFWRLLLFNAAVLIVAAAVLILSPVTVSASVSITEIAVLVGGSALMLAVNAVLLRATLRPLDGLTTLMKRVDLLRPGQRLSVRGDSDVVHLVQTFNEMLDRLEQERGLSTGRALAAQEGERQRIARELHDEIGQSLTAVLLALKRVADQIPPEFDADLRLIQEMTRDCLGEVSMVARRLRPGMLEDLGLLSALRSLAAEFTAASQVPVHLELDEPPALTPEIELVLYRIAQEALTNVARHAVASRASLSLRAQAGGVLLTVTDDGTGTGELVEGSGIRGMRERAMLIGSGLALRGAPGGGIELQLAVPVAAQRGSPR